MRYAWRAVVLAGVFAGVGMLTSRMVLAHAAERYGTYAPETRLAAWMGGLFAGGAAVTLVGIAMVWTRKKS